MVPVKKAAAKKTGAAKPAARKAAAKKPAAKPVRQTNKPAAAKAPQPALPGLETAEPVPAAVAETKPRKGEPPARRTAIDMAAAQREISVAEFFTKNRHLLGFDNPRKALLTTVKEAVDNALDACEEAGFLPELRVELIQTAENRFTVIIEDNGPGIVKAQAPKIFGKLLYGSKFHRLKQSRGQQGIGISAAAMYGQLTTGQPCKITSRIGAKHPAHYFEIMLNTQKNAPEVTRELEIEWQPEHGTKVEIALEAIFQRGKRSVEEYLDQVLVANPHVTLHYKAPDGDWSHRERATQQPPIEAVAIKPHPYGVELGMLMQMFKATVARNVHGFLCHEFSRVGGGVANEICAAAKVPASRPPRNVTRQEAEALYTAIQQTKIQRPPTNCLSPIGEELMLAGLKRLVPDAELYTAVSRVPAVYRGNPFLVEAAVAYGGKLPCEEPAELIRFANRVPLQYQQSACAISKCVTGTMWRNYGLNQPKGALPIGPLVVTVHIASAWVPFTSESKEAIASYPEITKEMKLALQECGRRLGMHIRRQGRLADAEKKKSYIKTYIPQLVAALQDILKFNDKQRDKAVASLTDILERTRSID
ncbi:MAG TPA: DNA topoisomerase VI subunit B [bacterium]|nr:DNA topoisomerase VI subunit B [bacterium]